MKTSTKWIIGIVIGLLVVCVLGGALAAGVGLMARSSWQMGSRYGQLWGDQGQMMPWNNAPDLPRQHMWMMPQRGLHGAWFGYFSPLRMFALPLLCLGLLALVALAIVLLVQRSRRPKVEAVVVEPAPVAAVVAPMESAVETPVETPAAGKVCPNCGRAVEAEWSHCPYCGAPQA